MARKGQKLNKIQKHRISLATRGEKNLFYGHHHTEAWKKDHSLKVSGHCGCPCSESKRKMLSKRMKGKNNPRFGYVRSLEERRHLSERFKGNKGNNWKGGITKKNRAMYYSLEWKLWRDKVFKRDKYRCRKCKNRGGISPHHIHNFSEELKLRFKVSNGITFCYGCHKLFHHIYGIKNNSLIQINEFISKEACRA